MKHREAGFTLIELMVVTACIGVLAYGMQMGRGTQQDFSGSSRQRLRASLALENELARLQAVDAAPTSGLFEGPELRRLPGAKGERVVTRLAPGLWGLRLSVTWKDAMGKLSHRELVSAIAPRKRGATL